MHVAVRDLQATTRRGCCKSRTGGRSCDDPELLELLCPIRFFIEANAKRNDIECCLKSRRRPTCEPNGSENPESIQNCSSQASLETKHVSPGSETVARARFNRRTDERQLTTETRRCSFILQSKDSDSLSEFGTGVKEHSTLLGIRYVKVRRSSATLSLCISEQIMKCDKKATLMQKLLKPLPAKSCKKKDSSLRKVGSSSHTPWRRKSSPPSASLALECIHTFPRGVIQGAWPA